MVAILEKNPRWRLEVALQSEAVISLPSHTEA